MFSSRSSCSTDACLQAKCSLWYHSCVCSTAFASVVVPAQANIPSPLRWPCRDGQPRQMAFIGYSNAEDAAAALQYFQSSYIDTCKLSIEVRALLVDRSITCTYASRRAPVRMVKGRALRLLFGWCYVKCVACIQPFCSKFHMFV